MRTRVRHPPHFRACIVIAIALSGFGVARVHAQPSRARARLDWRSNECVLSAGIIAAVEARLARAVFVDGDDANLLISGQVVAEEDGLVARVELIRGGERIGTRELRARDCTAMGRALPIVLALAVDLEAPNIVLALEPPEVSVQVGEARADDQHATPTAEASQSVSLRVGGALELGFLPEPVGSVRASLRVQVIPELALETRIGALLPAAALRDGAGISYWGAQAGLAGCPLLVRSESFALEGCLLLEGGMVVVRGEGHRTNRSSVVPHFDALIGLRALWTIPGVLEVGFESSFGLPLPSLQFTVTSSGGSEREIAAGLPVIGRLELTIGTSGW